MNKVILTGRITKNPELKYTQNQIKFVTFSIAVDRGYKDQNGNNTTDFINCVAWNNTADFMSKYILKGYLLGVEGELQVRTYQANDGSTRTITEVMCDRVENFTPRSNNAQPNEQQKVNNNPSVQNKFDVGNEIPTDDDLPF